MLSHNHNILIFINLLVIWKSSNSQWLGISSFKSRFSLPCLNNTFHCGDGSCISLDKLHNGYNDCLDGSDEFCFPGYVKCGKICVEAKNADNCFGFENCFKSNIIPKFCPYLKQKLCNANGTFHCKGYGECIFAEWMFDKKQDCYDGSDLDDEYVSIFKKILNNQYPEELLYRLNNKEKTTLSTLRKDNTLKNLIPIPPLWPNSVVVQPGETSPIIYKSNYSSSNKKPIKPLEGLELMSETTSHKPPLVFPTLIPYQVTKSQDDYKEQSLPSLSIESTSIKTSILPIIYPFIPLNERIGGHSQTTKGVNFFYIPNNGNNKSDNENLNEKLHFPSTIEKNISLDNRLETLKENVILPSDAFMKNVTKEINKSYNYSKIVKPTNNSLKEKVKNDDDINNSYLENIFGTEELVTYQGKSIQPTVPVKTSFTEQKFGQENTLSTIKSNINNIQTTVQTFYKLNEEIKNKESTINFLTPTTQSQKYNLPTKFDENNNIYKLSTKLPENNNFLLPHKTTTSPIKTTFQITNDLTTDKVPISENIELKENNSFSTTTSQSTIQNFETTQVNIVETIPLIETTTYDHSGSVTNGQQKESKNDVKEIIPLTSGSFKNLDVIEDNVSNSNSNNIAKPINIPQNWNFFGIIPKEMEKNYYSVEKFLTRNPKPIYTQSTFAKPKQTLGTNTISTTTTIVNVMNWEKTTATTPLFSKLPESTLLKSVNEQTTMKQSNFNENVNTEIEIVETTTLSTLGSQKNIPMVNVPITTTIKPFVKQNMSVEEYNNCIKKFINDNFYHFDVYGESMCKCSPGDSLGFLGLCRYKSNPIVIKLHIEKICGDIPSNDIEKKITRGIVSLLTNEDDIDDACFRTTKTNELVAEIFCKNCSLISVGKLFERSNMESKYNSNFYFTPAGEDACNDLQLNFCDKNATCVPLNDKYQCICEGGRKNASKLENFETDYGRNCHNNDQCDTLFGICIMYWLLLIPFLLFIIPCFCCLLYRICLAYDICVCCNERFGNIFPFFIKSKNRQKSRNVIIEDIKEAQKWQPEDTKPSSVHSTEDYQSNSRRKSTIALSDDEYTSKRSLKSRTSSIHSVEDYMIVDDETINYEDGNPPILKTKAEIHEVPRVGKEKIIANFFQTNTVQLQRHQSQPIIEKIHPKASFFSLTQIDKIDSGKLLSNQKHVPILSKTLSKLNVLDSDISKVNKISGEIQTIHSSLENVSTLADLKGNKLNDESKAKTLSQKTVHIDEISTSENVTSDVEIQSLKEGRTFFSKNSSSSLLSSHPIIEDVEEESQEATFMKNIQNLHQPLNDPFSNEKTNSSVKSLPYINQNSPSTSATGYYRHSISAIDDKRKYTSIEKKNSMPKLIQNTGISNTDSQTALSLNSSSMSLGPSIKNLESNNEKEISYNITNKNKKETIWEHYQHHTNLPKFSQTDSMDELEKLFVQRLKTPIKIKHDDPTNITQTTDIKTSNEAAKLEKKNSNIIHQTTSIQDKSQDPDTISIRSEKDSTKNIDDKMTEAEKLKNMLIDITKVSDYNFKEDNTFMNINLNETEIEKRIDQNKVDKDDTISNKNLIVNEEKISNEQPKVDVDNEHNKFVEKTNQQQIYKMKKDNKINVDEKVSIKLDKKKASLPKTTIKISRPSSSDKKRKISHFVSGDEKNIKTVDMKITQDHKKSDISRSKKISLKPPIPKFTSLKKPFPSSSGPQTSRSVQERKEIIDSPIARSYSFNLSKSSSQKTGLNKNLSKTQTERQLPTQVKVKLPKINESYQYNFDKEKFNKQDKNIAFPSLNKETSLPSVIKDYKKSDAPLKMNPTSSSLVKERTKQMENIISNKPEQYLSIKKTKTLSTSSDKKYGELKSLKNITPEKYKINEDYGMKKIPNIRVTIQKKGKPVTNNDQLCGVCKHDIIQILPKDDDKEHFKQNKIKSFIKQQDKVGTLTRNPKTHQLSAIKEKSEEYKNVKINEPSKIAKKMNYEEENLLTHRTNNFDYSRENSLIPVHFDSRYVGPPSARESARILETEGNYYAGDVDLDMPSPYILPVTEGDIRNCMFNNNELRKLKTNIPFYDWDRHSEIVKKEEANKQMLNHSMSESNLEKKLNTTKKNVPKNKYDTFDKEGNFSIKNKSRSYSPGTFKNIGYVNKNYIKKKTNITMHNNNSIYREKSNLSISSTGDERWNLAVVHEGDIERIPLPPLSYSYRSLNRK